MLIAAFDLLFSATTLLWLFAGLACAAALFGSMNRRRSRLVDALRDYVDRNQPKPKPSDGDQGSDS